MKKVINITIGGYVFYVEEDAFAKLDAYLASIKQHFASLPEPEEVVSDMEMRIAEHFLESKTGSKERVITESEVEKLITVMGTVKDFGASQDKEYTEPQNKESRPPKKLFRNPDDKILGGVSSGLAAYIGIDPVIVRVLFVLFTFAGGFTVVFYIILWIAVPEAHTPTEKMQMKGDPITLAGVEETLKKKVTETKNNSSTQRLLALPGSIIRRIGTFIHKVLFPVLRSILGFTISLVGIVGMLSVVAIFIILLVNRNSPYIDFPLQDILSTLEYYVVISLLFLMLFIPGLFVLLSGSLISGTKRMLNRVVSVSLAIVWSLAVIVSISLAVKIAPEYTQALQNDPRNQIADRAYNAEGFSKIKATGIHTIHISQAETFSITANGRQIDLDKLTITVENNTLHIANNANNTDGFKICIFCNSFTKASTIYIQMPTLEGITASGVTKVTSTSFRSQSLNIDLSGASKAMVEHYSENATISLSGATTLELSGDSRKLLLNISGASRLDARNYIHTTVSVEASGASTAHIAPITEAYISASGASRVYITGNPTIVSELSGAAKIYPEKDEPKFQVKPEEL